LNEKQDILIRLLLFQSVSEKVFGVDWCFSLWSWWMDCFHISAFVWAWTSTV